MRCECKQESWPLQVAHIRDKVWDPEATTLTRHDIIPWRCRVKKFGRNPLSLVAADLPLAFVIIGKAHTVIPYEASTTHMCTRVFRNAYHVAEDGSSPLAQPSIFDVRSWHRG
jgi:hypothetical protein